jgi:hypothetical protein
LFIRARHLYASWTSGGPPGGYIDCMALAQTNPDIIYIVPERKPAVLQVSGVADAHSLNYYRSK